MRQADQPIGSGSHRRRGRLGCPIGCLTQILGVLFLGLVMVWLLDALLAPYTFYYGGHFHMIPGWQGQGSIHSNAAGGDYTFWIYIEPTTPAYRKSDIKADAYLCTPRGERFRLRVGGDWPRSRPTDTRGIPVHLYMYGWSTFSADRRPHVDFYGAFGDRELVLEDRGSLPAAFRPDGTLYAPHDHAARRKETVRFTLTESSPWNFRFGGPSCPAGANEPASRPAR